MRSGLVGIARPDTAFSAVRYAPARGEVEPVAVACRATLAFDHANGTPTSSSNPERGQPSVARRLMRDGTAFLDLRSGTCSSTTRNPRAVPGPACGSRCRRSDPPPTLDLAAGPCEDVVVTLEVFETLTGRTSVFLSHTDFIDNPDLAPAPTRAVP